MQFSPTRYQTFGHAAPSLKYRVEPRPVEPFNYLDGGDAVYILGAYRELTRVLSTKWVAARREHPNPHDHVRLRGYLDIRQREIVGECGRGEANQ